MLKRILILIFLGCLVAMLALIGATQALCCCDKTCDPPVTTISPSSYCPGQLIHVVTVKPCMCVVTKDPCTKRACPETLEDYWTIAESASPGSTCTPPPPPPPPGGPGGPGGPPPPPPPCPDGTCCPPPGGGFGGGIGGGGFHWIY